LDVSGTAPCFFDRLQEGVETPGASGGVCADNHRTVFHATARENVVTGAFDNGIWFPGESGLGDHGRALGDLAINRNPLSGGNEDVIPGGDFINWN
jgi:hypothetical protein